MVKINVLRIIIFFVTGYCIGSSAFAQTKYELNSGWICANIKTVKESGQVISTTKFNTKNWIKATVPGTVLTTMLENKQIPDPFFGMNNKLINDIYFTGNDYYTYWFVKDFKESAAENEQVWLKFRGINYAFQLFINGKKITTSIEEGMLMRREYNITSNLSKDGNNRIAVLVYPPTVPGNPNGGQGGDGTIAKNLTTQYTAGWDWIQPIRDRNTGIWDKVTIEKTQFIQIKNPHIVTLVPGKRNPGDKNQLPATLKVSAEVENPTLSTIEGILEYNWGGKIIQKEVNISPQTTQEIQLPDFQIENPKLWWPSGYGEQNLHPIQLRFRNSQNKNLDTENVVVGIREIQNSWNSTTGSMQCFVNGQKIFIKGGNWIISDAMLRFSEERYDAEIRFHRDMNLNLIRIWGGAITERPEFYQACDKYGLLVFQDFWFSGDCNGRWLDPMKKEDQWTRRKYPDNHSLALTTAADQIKLIRNHPSLAFWCGGNEITPPDDILLPLRDSILPKLDGTRYFFDYSNSDSMSKNIIGGNGDGPYGIQDYRTFWTNRSFPYNSEIGSVGVGDYVSLQRFIPKENLVAPTSNADVDSIWDYHKYIGYHPYIDQYGKPKDAKDFAMKAQLINYDQYRGLMEGFSSRMWDWYTGVMIWKTQNPWTALRGQMYDYYLDVNASLYGLRKGSEAIHFMMNPTDSMLFIVNNSFKPLRNMMMEVKVYDVETGKDTLYSLMFNEIGPTTVQKYFPIGGFLKDLNKREGIFVGLKLYDQQKSIISENFYWLPGVDNQYSALQRMKKTSLKVSIVSENGNKIKMRLQNEKQNPVAFFNRVALIETETGKRILPTFFSDNYFSVLPGEEKIIELSYPDNYKKTKKSIEVYGWNVNEQNLSIQ